MPELRSCLLRPGLRIKTFLADFSTSMARFLLGEASSNAAADHELRLLARNFCCDADICGNTWVTKHSGRGIHLSINKTLRRTINVWHQVPREWFESRVFEVLSRYFDITRRPGCAAPQKHQHNTPIINNAFLWLYKCVELRVRHEIRGKMLYQERKTMPLNIKHFECYINVGRYPSGCKKKERVWQTRNILFHCSVHKHCLG